MLIALTRQYNALRRAGTETIVALILTCLVGLIDGCLLKGTASTDAAGQAGARNHSLLSLRPYGGAKGLYPCLSA